MTISNDAPVKSCCAISQDRIRQMQAAAVKYINAQGPHISEPWKELLAKEFDLEIMRGWPYEPVRVKP